MKGASLPPCQHIEHRVIPGRYRIWPPCCLSTGGLDGLVPVSSFAYITLCDVRSCCTFCLLVLDFLLAERHRCIILIFFFFFFLENFHFFLEIATFFLTSRWNIPCPVRSEVLYFGQRYVPILKTLLFVLSIGDSRA
jgi:hypothetical protein